MTKGSLKHIRCYANDGSKCLSAAVFTAAPSLTAVAEGDLLWVSPVADDEHIECWNEQFLQRLDLLAHLESFRGFWPFSGSGTPHWDALATVPTRLGPGVVMVEAKAHEGELVKPGDKTGAMGASLELIRESCEKARRFYGVSSDTPAWETSYYQVGNRLAHLYWMNQEAKVPTWLVWLFFTSDASVGVGLTAPEWHNRFEEVKAAVGLRRHHPLEGRVAVAYLPPSPPSPQVTVSAT